MKKEHHLPGIYFAKTFYLLHNVVYVTLLFIIIIKFINSCHIIYRREMHFLIIEPTFYTCPSLKWKIRKINITNVFPIGLLSWKHA